MDFLTLLAAAGTFLGGLATWKSYSLEKNNKELLRVKIDLSIDKIIYSHVPDTESHKIFFQIMNSSPTPTKLKSLVVLFHEKSYEMSIPEQTALCPYQRVDLACWLSALPNEILDGRYPASVHLETSSGDRFDYFFSESKLRSIQSVE